MPNFSLEEKIILLGVIMRFKKLKDDAHDIALEMLQITPEDLDTKLSALREKILND
jgi:hypothetical protein